jgi:hypothetical protein
MEQTKTQGYKGVIVMKEHANGRWYYMHHPARMPLTSEELKTLQKYSDTRWIKISKAQ